MRTAAVGCDPECDLQLLPLGVGVQLPRRLHPDRVPSVCLPRLYRVSRVPKMVVDMKRVAEIGFRIVRPAVAWDWLPLDTSRVCGTVVEPDDIPAATPVRTAAL